MHENRQIVTIKLPKITIILLSHQSNDIFDIDHPRLTCIRKNLNVVKRKNAMESTKQALKKLDINSPTPQKEVTSMASPTGVLDEVHTSIQLRLKHLDLDLEESPVPVKKTKVIGNTQLLDIAGFFADLPPLLGPKPQDRLDENRIEKPKTKVATTFEEKEQQREVKACP